MTDKDKIVERCAEYYRKLYTSVMEIPAAVLAIPDILSSEIEKAISQMNNNKVPGEDGIVIELMKEGSAEVYGPLARLFTSCIRTRKTPKDWNNAVIILLHKKGDIKTKVTTDP